MTYIPKYFKKEELLPPYLHHIPDWKAWLMFDERILSFADFVRDVFGATTCNTKTLNYCGFRPFDYKGGAVYSQHKFGRALDLHILNIENQNLSISGKIIEYNNVRNRLKLLGTCKGIYFEDNISWLHGDCGNRDGDFKP